MTLRKLTGSDVEFELVVEPEHVPIEGNASAIDEETDRENEEMIREQLERGNEWAWCCVRVSAKWRGFEGVDYLGACSYESEGDFKQLGGYYDDMKAQALEALNNELAWLGGLVEELKEQGVR